MSLDRKAFLAALARQVVAVDVPEFGTIHFREMSLRERAAFHAKLFGTDNKNVITPQDWAVNLIAASVCDADGKLWFSDDDAVELWDQSQTKLGALVVHAERVNGLGATSQADAEKNSEPALTNTSATK